MCVIVSHRHVLSVLSDLQWTLSVLQNQYYNAFIGIHLYVCIYVYFSFMYSVTLYFRVQKKKCFASLDSNIHSQPLNLGQRQHATVLTGCAAALLVSCSPQPFEFAKFEGLREWRVYSMWTSFVFDLFYFSFSVYACVLFSLLFFFLFLYLAFDPICDVNMQINFRTITAASGGDW